MSDCNLLSLSAEKDWDSGLTLNVPHFLVMVLWRGCGQGLSIMAKKSPLLCH